MDLLKRLRLGELATPSNPSGVIPHVYKWMRDYERSIAEPIARADAGPWFMLGDDVPADYWCKHVLLTAHIEHDSGEGRRQIETKGRLTREETRDGQRIYRLYIAPLRGTDCWPVIEAFVSRLGPIAHLGISGMHVPDPGASKGEGCAISIAWLIR